YRLHDAEEYYNKIKDKNHTSVKLFYVKLLEKQKQFIKACNLLAKFRASEPDNLKIFLEYEYSKEKLGRAPDLDFNEPHFSDILASEYKENYQVQLSYACRLIKNGKREVGLNLLAHIVNHNPDYLSARLSYLIALEKEMSEDEIVSGYEKLIAEKPGFWK